VRTSARHIFAPRLGIMMSYVTPVTWPVRHAVVSKRPTPSPLSRPFIDTFVMTLLAYKVGTNAPARLFKAADDDAMLTCLYSRVAHPCSVNRYQYLYFSLELRNPSSYTSTRYRGDGEPHLLEQLKNLRPCRSLSRYIISLQRHMASTRSMATLS